LDALARPRLKRFIEPALRDAVLMLMDTYGVFFTPVTSVQDCRDPKDNKYLELALAAGAEVIVSGDADLLVLDPWRGVRILRPADYLAQTETRGG
jgi:putative PIN family toxin of toxin-antitoxin system